MSDRLYVRMYERDSHWKDFREILVLGTFMKACCVGPNLVEIGQ